MLSTPLEMVSPYDELDEVPGPGVEESLIELERRGLVRPNYGAWLKKARPDFDFTYRHFDYMRWALDSITQTNIRLQRRLEPTAEELRRCVFEVSVRHGKTEHNTIGYIAYRIWLDPSVRVLFGTYSQPQARKVSRAIRRIVKRLGVAMSADRDSVDEWETAAGGGLRAVGRGSGTASINADLIVIDDPLGSRAEAESKATREACWDWLTDDMLARSEPHTAAIFSMPRWHKDDPIGRIKDRQGDLWGLVSLPCEAEADDPVGRLPGELLWPELRGRDWVDDQRTILGSYGWASLANCRPKPRQGGLFKWDWWGLLKGVPAVGPMVRYWDLAGTEVMDDEKAHDPDYSAGVLACRMVDERTAIVDVERFRYSVAMRDAKLVEVAKKDLELYGHRVSWWFETEQGIQGKERTQKIVRRLQNLGLTVKTEHPTGKKIHRAEPLAAAAEAGNVLLCPGPWRDSFRLEAANFTGKDDGDHDDQIDGASGAFSKLDVEPDTITQTSARM